MSSIFLYSNEVTDFNSNSSKKTLPLYKNMEELLENGDQDYIKSIKEKENLHLIESQKHLNNLENENKNSFLVYSNPEKIVLNKGKIIKYGRSAAKLNFFDYLCIEDFILSFNNNINKENEVTFPGGLKENPSNCSKSQNQYTIDFSEPCDNLNLLCSNEKIQLYNKKWKSMNLTFGQSPLEYMSSVGKNLQNFDSKFAMQEKYKKVSKCLEKFPEFSEKFLGLVSFRSEEKCNDVGEDRANTSLNSGNNINGNGLSNEKQCKFYVSSNKLSKNSVSSKEENADSLCENEGEEDDDINCSSNSFSKGNKKYKLPIVCEFCHQTFSTSQAYGGHLIKSRKESGCKGCCGKNNSLYHYSTGKKKEGRKGKWKNHIVEKAKKILCEHHDINYCNLNKTKKGKMQLKKIVAQYDKEYKEIKNELSQN